MTRPSSCPAPLKPLTQAGPIPGTLYAKGIVPKPAPGTHTIFEGSLLKRHGMAFTLAKGPIGTPNADTSTLRQFDSF
jgi:hypothetical protein